MNTRDKQAALRALDELIAEKERELEFCIAAQQSLVLAQGLTTNPEPQKPDEHCGVCVKKGQEH